MQRRLAAPPFAQRSVRDFAPAMLDAAEAMAGRWPERAGVIDADVEMRRVTLDVLERTIFADGFGRDAEDIRRAMCVYFDTIGRLGALDLIGAPNFIPRLSQLRVRGTLRFFEAAIDDLIAVRRKRLDADPGGAPQDMLTRLLQAGDGGAAHETTANTLTWALFLLSQAPEWMRRVEREAVAALREAPETLAERLVDTKAVLEEAVRLYPPIAAISRVAVRDDELAGVSLRRGTLVVISPWVLHRHRTLWDDPDTFDPSRFLPEARGRIDRFAYLPFGAGARTCIGQAFALQEAALVLATIVARFSVQLAPAQTVWPLLRVTLRPADGLRLIVRPKPAPPALARAA